MWVYLLIGLAGIGAFIISTIAGGGGALILLPVLSVLVGAKAAAPLVSLGAMIGRPVRLILFWKYIHWKLVLHYVPGAVIGALVGTYLFSTLDARWVQIVLGLFLISTVFQYRFGQKTSSFTVKLVHFFPIGLVVSFISAIAGGTGPILNPFYINYGLLKEKMIATKTANSFFGGLTKITGYVAFGALNSEMVLYGVVLGIGVTIGNVLGKRLLRGLSNEVFMRWVIALMIISGVLLIINNL